MSRQRRMRRGERGEVKIDNRKSRQIANLLTKLLLLRLIFVVVVVSLTRSFASCIAQGRKEVEHLCRRQLICFRVLPAPERRNDEQTKNQRMKKLLKITGKFSHFLFNLLCIFFFADDKLI